MAAYRTTRRRYPPERGGKPKKTTRWDGSLSRLTVAVLLFLVCFAGRLGFPEQTEPYRQRLAQLLSASTDFSAAFTDLGEDISQGNDLLSAVGDWCVTVFAPTEVTLDTASQEELAALRQQETAFLTSWDGDLAALEQHLLPEAFNG